MNHKITKEYTENNQEIQTIEAAIYAAIPTNVKLANIYVALTNVLHRFLHEDLAHRSKLK